MLETVLSNLMRLLMSLAMIAFGAFCGFMAVTTAYRQFQARWSARQSHAWPVCQGEVVSANLKHGYRGAWKPEIKYRYTMGGVEYTGQRVAFHYTETYTQGEAQAIMARYPLNNAVQIYYDPARPQESTLEQTSHATGCFDMIAIPAFLALPALLCISAGLMPLISLLTK